jgi:hypothetical protein
MTFADRRMPPINPSNICPLENIIPSCSALKRVWQLSAFKENCRLVVELSEFRIAGARKRHNTQFCRSQPFGHAPRRVGRLAGNLPVRLQRGSPPYNETLNDIGRLSRHSGLGVRRNGASLGQNAINEFLCLVHGGSQILCDSSVADELVVLGYGDLPSDHERFLFEIISAIGHCTL